MFHKNVFSLFLEHCTGGKKYVNGIVSKKFSFQQSIRLVFSNDENKGDHFITFIRGRTPLPGPFSSFDGVGYLPRARDLVFWVPLIETNLHDP